MKRDELRTPGYIIDRVSKFRPIDLDPCASSSNIKNIPARKFYTKESNGLVQPWSGFVFLNPPYSDISSWLSVLCKHASGGIAVVPVEPGAVWFQDLVLRSSAAVCFMADKPVFKGHVRPVTFNVCVALYADLFGDSRTYDEQIGRFSFIFGELGIVLTPIKPHYGN